MSVDAGKAVFLSYASQDAEAARKICDALRAAGVEVWFDQSELRGGDAWDQQIRRQIKECALFVPVISANTQARKEGYFRREWNLAAARTLDMARGKPFLLPVVIDGTHDANADVPEEFAAVQWTRLPNGETPGAFCARVAKLLAGERPPTFTPISGGQSGGTSAPARVHRGWWIAVSGALACAALLAWRPWNPAPVPTAKPTRVPAAGSSAELARLRARLIPDEWKKEDLEPWSASLDRLIRLDEQNADAWALQSIINSLQIVRGYEAGTKPLETGRSAAARALHLSPDSPLAALALGMHHGAMVIRGGDPQTARPYLRTALAGMPADALTRYADVTTAWQGYDFEQINHAAGEWLAADPAANFPAFITAQMHLALRDFGEALKWSERSASARGTTGMRGFVALADAHYYLRADLTAARNVVDRIPASLRAAHRVLNARWLVAMAEQRWDVALQELALTPEAILYESTYYGPKALLAGFAHQAAGRSDAALAQFRDAERVLRSALEVDAQNEPLQAMLALTLACLGRTSDAKKELALVEPLVRGRPRTAYKARVMVALAQANAILGQVEPMIFWLRELLSGPVNIPFTPASLRIDCRFEGVIARPEVQALLAEFAHLDAQKAAAVAPPDNKSIAVLAFANIGAEKDAEYFSDGVSEELLNVLAKIPGLRVAARTSSFYFKGKDTPIPEIARQLDVAYLVEGSVRKAGSQLRISARLIKASNGAQVWADDFREELKDVFALQDKIARSIAQNLQLQLGEIRRTTVNPEAHRLVLEGRHFWNQRSESPEATLAKAVNAFQQALAIDSNFAEAHAGLGDVWVTRGLYRSMDGRGDSVAGDFVLARAEAQRALELNPALVEPHVTLGYVAYCETQFSESEQHFARAFARNPNYALAYHWHALLLTATGRYDKSLEQLERSLRLDPLSPNTLWSATVVNTFAGRLPAALEANERALALKPNLVPMHAQRALILLKLARTDEAVAAARVVGRDLSVEPRWWADGDAVYVLRKAGLTEEAADHAKRALATFPAIDYRRALVYAALGQHDQALPAIGNVPTISLSRLYWHPMWDPVRDTPAFQEVFVRRGVANEYQVARATAARMKADSKK